MEEKKSVAEHVRFELLSALVIDDMGAMRHALKTQLQIFGMNDIHVSGSAEEAVGRLDCRSYDLILCDYNLKRSSSGQHFLEFLRHEGRLKPSSVFVMVTAESEYDFVANAAEYVPDDYTLKPCPEKRLKSRIERLFDRRNFLMPILLALEGGQYEAAIASCDDLLENEPGHRWIMEVLRRKIEAQVALKDYLGALKTCNVARAVRDDVPWVSLELARANLSLGNIDVAHDIASKLVAMNSNYVAAYELLSRIGEARQDSTSALEMLMMSSRILPSARRFRVVSESAYLMGKHDEARKASESAIKLSKGSIVERSDDYLSLAQTMVDMGDCSNAISILEVDAKRFGEKGMFGVMQNAILAQAYLGSGDTGKARKLIERASNLLADRTDGMTMTVLGKAMLKSGDLIAGLKMFTRAIQVSGDASARIANHVTKAMGDVGHEGKVADVIDGGRRRILDLVNEANKLMRAAHFADAHQKLHDAFEIHPENIEALLAATQLHLLWLKRDGLDDVLVERTRGYLGTLDRLVPQNEKVMNFYKFFQTILGG
jgi:CheY-like chemotaxis protein